MDNDFFVLYFAHKNHCYQAQFVGNLVIAIDTSSRIQVLC